MKIDAKNFNNDSNKKANRIQNHIKQIINHSQVEVIPKMQAWLNTHMLTKVMNHINRMKNKDHILIDEEKAFAKIQHPFMTNPSANPITNNYNGSK